MRQCQSLILTAALAACSQFPELDASVDEQIRDAPYPDLVPVESLTARIGEDRITPGLADAVEGRASGLKARSGPRGGGAAVDTDRVARLRARAAELRQRQIE